MGKTLVKSDFKHNRVEDPTQISSKQEKQVKAYVKNFFDKAVAKKEQRDRRKAKGRAKLSESQSNSHGSPATPAPDVSVKPSPASEEQDENDEPVQMDISDPEEEEDDDDVPNGGGPPPPPPPPVEDPLPLVVGEVRSGSAEDPSAEAVSGEKGKASNGASS